MGLTLPSEDKKCTFILQLDKVEPGSLSETDQSQRPASVVIGQFLKEGGAQINCLPLEVRIDTLQHRFKL